MGVGDSEIEVSPADPDLLAVLGSLFGRAFVNEPMMCWPMGEGRDAAERFTRCFSFFLEIVLQLGLVWESGPGLGAAVWIPNGQFERWDDHPWNQPRIRALADDGGERYDEFWRWVDSRSPQEPSLQLDSIAVDPSAQGRGYGSALIRHGLARARRAGIGAFLSTGTERNVAIYSRCGFHVTERVQSPGGGPNIWFMRWDP